ncbi:MAG: hypothetical protein A2086_09365 [Spirochaetes bacterium GWD1_27_9]|nr:MAG: hypothetical protein A2Z98_18300 [Spirochaetes bacterium GWB1_27_13]OHD24099.1 MAG: hypothetical protein A2Y34_09340 [Spirochaetes bacterium GWC1_27_15]OHD37369.1 MAG: hypothetical protein A2086_09365 [Spirochaetes bacterium GWD1_27_9]
MTFKHIFLILHFIMMIFIILINYLKQELHFSTFLGIIFMYYLVISVISLIILIINIIKKKNDYKYKLKFMILIPSILFSLFLIHNAVIVLTNNYVEAGMTIPTILLGIGIICWIFDWSFTKYLKTNLVYDIINAILFPVTAYLLYVNMWGFISI